MLSFRGLRNLPVLGLLAWGAAPALAVNCIKLCRSLILPVLVLGLWGVPAYADCTGSGTTWTCTAGTTISQVATRYNTASDGATFTFASGSYTWNDTLTFSMTKGITLVCGGTCTVTSSGTVFAWPSSGGTTSKTYRISGFTFSHSGGNLIWDCPGGGCPTILVVQAFRFDHNTVTLASGNSLMYLGENASAPRFVYGVIDHNTVSAATTTLIIKGIENGQGGTNDPPNRTLGSGTNAAFNLFIEDNIFTHTAHTEAGSGCLDNDGGGMGWVIRFNDFNNCRVLSHGTAHAWGPANWEVYRNKITYGAGTCSNQSTCDGYHEIHHQGAGTTMIWGNTISNTPGTSRDTFNAIVIMDTGSENARPGDGICDGNQVGVDGNRTPLTTYRGYPCKRQIARDQDAVAFPVGSWENRWASDSALQNVRCDPSYGPTVSCTNHLVENRDYFLQTASFTGATGLGVGPLSSRPANCTTGTEALDAGRVGVLYWATDQGTWNASTSNARGVQVNGADGVLYMCTATNTWSVYYTPYTYPHPLISGAAPPDTTPPATPTGLTLQ